jgi:type I restriction enzyme S subunit
VTIGADPTRASREPEWLSHTPGDWTVDRLKWSISGVFGGVWGDEPNGVDDIVCVRVADFDRTRFVVAGKPPTLRAVEGSERTNRLLCKGDLLIEKSGGGENQPVGCVVHFDHAYEAVCSNFVARMPVALGMCPQFWLYMHANLYASRLNLPAIKQTTGIQNLDTDAYFNIRVPFPSFGAQRAIADYLDRETARLDALVAAKERVLRLLAEKRRALITRAVTRGLPAEAAAKAGLDPSAPLRESGIPWLAEIPAHWQFAQVKRAAEVIDCKHRTVPFVDEGVPLASIREVQSWEVDLSSAKMTTEDEYLLMIEGDRDPRAGDVIVSRNATVGAAALVPCGLRFCLGQDVSLIRPRVGLEPAFLNWLFRSDGVANQIISASIGSTFFRINVEQIKELVIPLPELEEQRAIVTHVAIATSKLDAVRAATEHTIALLKERRAALIAAAVTGQIDVGGAAYYTDDAASQKEPGRRQ